MTKSKKTDKKKASQNDFVVKYVIPEELHDRYVNGIWGGYTQDGMMNIHFYHERLPLPKKTYHSITADGQVSRNGNAEFGGDVIRMVQSSVIMDVNMAFELRDWLNERLTVFEKEREVNENKK